jgi:hypothetical protein
MIAQLKYFLTIFLPLEESEVFKMSWLGVPSKSIMINIGKVLDYPIVCKEAWRDWRKEISSLLKCASASMVSAYYGHHYDSYKKTLTNHICNVEPCTGFSLLDQAKLHGEMKEPIAKRAYMEINKHLSPKVIDNGEKTHIVTMVDMSGYAAFMMCTPDLIVEVNKQIEVVEFKCPYFEIKNSELRANRSIGKIAEDFAFKHKYGKESSFIQSMIYAVFCANTKHFSTFYYITDDIDESIVVYKYEIPDLQDAASIIMRAAEDIKYNLAKEPGDIKARTRTQDKRNMTKRMAEWHTGTFIYHFKDDGKWHLNDSDEETSDDSKD